MPEQQRVEAVLKAIQLPPFVTEIRHSLDNDAAGDPAVWIWVVLQDDVTESDEFFERSEVVRSSIIQSLRRSEIERWPYVRFRGQSEQAELDKADAA